MGNGMEREVSEICLEFQLLSSAQQAQRHGFEGRGKNFFGTPKFWKPERKMKQNIAVFIIVIKTSKRLPAANKMA
jgi:hypothetical protein